MYFFLNLVSHRPLVTSPQKLTPRELKLKIWSTQLGQPTWVEAMYYR